MAPFREGKPFFHEKFIRVVAELAPSPGVPHCSVSRRLICVSSSSVAAVPTKDQKVRGGGEGRVGGNWLGVGGWG